MRYAAFMNDTALTSFHYPLNLQQGESNGVQFSIFSGCVNLKSVEIPEGVTKLAREIFAYHVSLTDVTLPASLTAIENNAFSDCASLRAVILPDSLVDLGFSAFSGCAALDTVTLSPRLTSIGGGAFSGTGLTEVTLADTLQALGENAFGHCPALRAVSLPGTLTIPLKGGKFGTAFADCPALERVTLTGDAVAESFGQILAKCGAQPAILLSDTITALGDHAFQGCDFLTSIVLPEGLTAIGNQAFAGCRALTEITLPDSLSEVGYEAFRDTPLLSEAAALYPASLEEAQTAEDLSGLMAGKRIIPITKTGLDSPMLCAMAPALRTPDSRAADFALVTRVRYESRSDYTGPAQDTITEAYLCARDDTVYLIWRHRDTPPIFGMVTLGSWLRGDAATPQQIWAGIEAQLGDRTK